jgi:hypothetical protein
MTSSRDRYEVATFFISEVVRTRMQSRVMPS